ncbi:hypothetical protein B0H16DRAFT_1500498 [Mycena metata]|uniref:Arrestin-like N-terminal domain-containing protein n=1 Tax=Mycena metata TaxID=1033252 RepID=A0AAD7K5R9_9AGAR|nr:hypothetical protein B0H16DRAFT_1500498 [Mycena metata]
MATPSSAQGFEPDAPPPYIATAGAEHRFPLLGRNQKHWGSLAVTSAARSARSIPLFYEEDRLQGTFELADSQSTQSISSIKVSVLGSVVTGPLVDDTAVFLKLPAVLWSRKTSTGHAGHRAWPFSIPLPREVIVGDTAYALPESFLERHTRLSVIYEMSVVVSRGMFRPDYTFKTRFRYVPCTQPTPPSTLRQHAYALGLPLPGPTDDLEGWQTFETVMAHGHVFKSRQAVVRCTLSLATPHSYTRGGPIPCYLTLESGDLPALDFFADPAAVRARLRRCVHYQGVGLSSMQQHIDSSREFVDVAFAVWWKLNREGRPDDNPHTRTLEGEIHVPADVVASARMHVADFSISYSIELLPSSCIQFTPTSQAPLLSVPVTIATMYPTHAPRPVVYAAPSYENEPSTDTRRNDAITYTQLTGLRR